MITPQSPLRHLEQKLQTVQTLMIMIMVIFLVQLWLITIALEEYMAMRSSLAIQTFLASLGCFGVNLVLLKNLYVVDGKKDQYEKP